MSSLKNLARYVDNDLCCTHRQHTCVETDIINSQYTQPIRNSLHIGMSRDRIELPRDAIRVIEADVLAVGLGIFLNPIVAHTCRV